MNNNPLSDIQALRATIRQAVPKLGMLSFATSIPVLLTATKRLDWPFSVLDLQQLLP